MARTEDGYPIQKTEVRKVGDDLVVRYYIIERGRLVVDAHKVRLVGRKDDEPLPTPRLHRKE